MKRKPSKFRRDKNEPKGIKKFYALMVDGHRYMMSTFKSQCLYEQALVKSEEPEAEVEVFVVFLNVETFKQTGMLRVYKPGQTKAPDMSAPGFVKVTRRK